MHDVYGLLLSKALIILVKVHCSHGLVACISLLLALHCRTTCILERSQDVYLIQLLHKCSCLPPFPLPRCLLSISISGFPLLLPLSTHDIMAIATGFQAPGAENCCDRGL